jgi:hypothetical protein
MRTRKPLTKTRTAHAPGGGPRFLVARGTVSVENPKYVKAVVLFGHPVISDCYPEVGFAPVNFPQSWTGSAKSLVSNERQGWSYNPGKRFDPAETLMRRDKDEGAWSIPKGEYAEGENPLDAAKKRIRRGNGNRAARRTHNAFDETNRLPIK